METKATAKYVRIAPRKARLLADLIRGCSAHEAEAELYCSPKRAAGHLLKLLRSALANAKEAKQNLEKLYIKEIRVDHGPILKRWRPRARGSAGKIEKKTSHLTIILAEGEHAAKRKFTIIKKEKESKEKREKHEKQTDAPTTRQARLAAASKEIEKKTTTEKPKKRTFFRRKSV